MPEKVTRGRWAVGLLLGLIIVLCLPATVAADECEFLGGFKTLHDLIPDEVGECAENASPLENGIFQRTTNGSLTWNEADDTVRFTNGLHTWVNGANGLESIPHDAIAQLRGFMARALMKEAVEDYIIEHGMWRYIGLRSSEDIGFGISGTSPKIHIERIAIGLTNHFSWRGGWNRLNPNQEGVHHLTPRG